MLRRSSVRFSSVVLGFITCVGIAGCSGTFHTEAVGSPAAGGGIRGNVHGGQSPIAGSAVYFFAASTAGYGTPNQSLLKTTSPGVSMDGAGVGYVTTDGSGTFTITGDYTCPANDFVYLLAVGGNPGVMNPANSSAIKEMTALYPCSSLTAESYIELNEVTTVASVTALRAFMDPLTGAVATSPGNVQGLTHAFETAGLLVDMSSGVANTATPNGLGNVPALEINTLADVLAACVNSATGDSSCNTLFTAATPALGPAPVDTLQAMIDIATNPAQNVGAMYALVTATAPFQPTLPAQYNGFTHRYDGQPNDWTLAIVYMVSTLPTNPLGNVNFLRIDSQGNVWATAGNNTALQLSNTGEVNYDIHDGRIQNGGTYTSLAIDESDNLWIDDGSYATTKIDSDGTLDCTGTTYCLIPGSGSSQASIYGSLNYLNNYGGVAIQPSTGEPWFGTSGNNPPAVVEADQTGVGLAFLTGGGLYNPRSLAFDYAGNIWVANYGGQTVTKMQPDGTFLSGATGFTGGGLNAPLAIAIDGTGSAWAANGNSASISKLSPLGVPDPNSPFSGGGLNFLNDLAIDGAGNVWAASSDAAVSEFNGATGAAMTPSLGYFPGVDSNGNYATYVFSVAIDASGNVWMAGYDDFTVSELVGAGTPTVTPLVVAAKNGTIGVRP
jgi:hypothetical protein